MRRLFSTSRRCLIWYERLHCLPSWRLLALCGKSGRSLLGIRSVEKLGRIFCFFSPENRPEVGDGSFPGGWLLEMMIQLEEQILFKQVGGKTHHLILPHNFAGLEFSYGKRLCRQLCLGKRENQESNKTLFDNQNWRRKNMSFQGGGNSILFNLFTPDLETWFKLTNIFFRWV